MDTNFKTILKETMDNHKFLQFDSFIIKEMGFSFSENEGLQEEEIQEIRRKAFKEFRKRTNKHEFASMPTMRRWFGIHGMSRPSRENVYEICFYLKVNREKIKDFLTKGLGEPSFQINDYQEIIFLYGIENQFSYEECQKMIRIFEGNLDHEVEFQKTHTTKELCSQYEASKKFNKEEFILWMSDRADWFKGYSQTVMDYLGRIRTNIIDEIRADAKDRLDELLSEAGYSTWLKQHKKDVKHKDEKSLIKSFIQTTKNKKHYHVDEITAKNIVELCRIALGEKEANTKLLSEVYACDPMDKMKENLNNLSSIRIMSGKYLSDLFHVPEKKEQEIRLSQALRVLNELDDTMPCPEWIRQLGETYTNYKGDFSSVEDAKQTLVLYQKEQRRRCLMIQRGDILPMILHIAQQRYLRNHEDEYVAEDAKNEFCQLANSILNACNMENLSEQFELDVALLASFQPDEMYSYSDILDALELRKEG